MPAATPRDHGVPAVGIAAAYLEDMLKHAESVKPTTTVEPPLDEDDFQQFLRQADTILDYPDNGVKRNQSQRYAIIETAARDVLQDVIFNFEIESPEFVRVWNLLDILSFLSDHEQCDPALLFWLVEELLDSQTVPGCRTVFDFLESRRERITAKHFRQKQLVILRSCNELLRRLSRVLEPAFCGRVFIFMFQSFPLGDKSSVNLRGEYHVENITTWDQDVPVDDKMDVDTDTNTQGDSSRRGGRAGSSDKRKEKRLDTDALYPSFWSLQDYFNQPKKLLEPQGLAAFKTGLEATMDAFLSIKAEQPSRAKERLEKQLEENKKVLKKKRDSENEDLATAFNPKYLTSRHLFKLEISDLTFRRSFLVQALIIMEFLLALSPKAKEKLAGVKAANKSVLYSDQQLPEDETKWVTDMKAKIANYLKQQPEGAYFYRMIETVLSRDKNWVRWKIENCPSIELPLVKPETFVEARSDVGRLAATKRRDRPAGSLSLDFLVDQDEESAWEKLKDPSRYRLPELGSFKSELEDADFDIERATTAESKAAAIEAKASTTWRALRIAKRTRLSAFDRIENDDDISAVFEERTEKLEEGEGDLSNGENVVFPEDRRPVVIVDPAGGAVRGLLAKYPGTFGRVPCHIVGEPQEGEAEDKSLQFVDTAAFGIMRDGDQFLEFKEEEPGKKQRPKGTSKRALADVSGSGKIAVLVLDWEGAHQVKDNDLNARYVFVQVPSEDELRTTLKEGGLGDVEIQQALKNAQEATEHSTASGIYDLVVSADELEGAIFGRSMADGDVAMDEA